MLTEICDYLPEKDDRIAGHDEVYSRMNGRVVDGLSGLPRAYTSND